MDKVIAVVIPTFNRMELTHEAINSVISVRPDLIDIIVVDDCGNPAYRAESERNVSGIIINAITTPFNVGPGLARKLAVQQSSVDAIAFLDSDDVFESSWLDAGLDAFFSEDAATRKRMFIAGEVRHGTFITKTCLRFLRYLPGPLRGVSIRIAAVFFNPFYTSGIIVSREICFFSDTLRYCEDYYTNFIAIFKARKIVISPLIACSISRKPGSSGGLSSLRTGMFEGEMAVRCMMLRSKHVPAIYKFLVPFGMAYQVARTAIKWFMHGLKMSIK